MVLRNWMAVKAVEGHTRTLLCALSERLGAEFTVQPVDGQTACVACGVGKHDEGDETCQSCPAGWAQPSSGRTACVACGEKNLVAD